MVFVQTVKQCLPEKANFFKKIDESTIFCQFPQSVRKITSLELFKILWNAFSCSQVTGSNAVRRIVNFRCVCKKLEKRPVSWVYFIESVV